MSSGRAARASRSRTLSTRSSSTQPPDTEPTIWPSSRIATIAPIGRGAEPQVLTIVPSAARWPLFRQSSAVRSTSMSTLSMRKCYRNATALIARFGRRCLGDSNARAMAGRDFPHDGEAQSTARTRRAGHAIETLEYAVALRSRNAGPVVFHLEECVAVGASGAHRDMAAAVRIVDRVVHEV